MTKRTVSILTFITLSIMIALLAIFMQSQVSLNRAQDEALALIGYDHKVSAVNKFYWARTDQATFALDFSDQKGDRYYAIIEREGGDIHYFPEDDLISEQDAKAITAHEMKDSKILQARLGLYDNEPVWEVTLKNKNQTVTYYLLSAEDGEWIQTISNI